MACYQTSTLVSLGSREAITLPDVRGTTLRVTKGTLWLTQERRRNDVVLREGDTFVVEFDGNTVVEARHDASFMLVGRRGRELALPRCAAPLTRVAARVAGWLTPPRHVPYF
jgi:hypothetical protein